MGKRIIAAATAALALGALLLVTFRGRESLPEAFARRHLAGASSIIGPTAKGSEWKNGGIVAQVIPGAAVILKTSEKDIDAQVQWIGAIVRTAQQGGPLATRVLAMNDQLEKKWSWSGAGKGAVGGAVQGAFTGAAAGPKGAAAGAALGAVGGAIVGGTGGWGRRNLKGGNFGVNGGWSEQNGANVNAELNFNWKREADMQKSGSFGVNGGWSEQNGANVNAELKFNWKQEAELEKRLIDEIVSYAGNAIRVGIAKGAATLGQKGARYLDIFADDLRAAAAALRSLAERDSHPDREKLSMLPPDQKYSWHDLLGLVSPSSSGVVKQQEEYAAKRISTGDRIRGAISGGAMGFYDFGMQGAVGGAIGGWFGRRKLSGSFGVSGGWSEQNGANVNANLQWNFKEGVSSSDRKWTSRDRAASVPQVLPGTRAVRPPKADDIHAQVQWIGALERTAQAGSSAATFALALDRKVSQDGDREKNWAGAAIGAVSGYEKNGWRGAVAGAVGGFFGRKLGEEATNRELSESSQWSVGQQVALETKLVNDVLEFAAKRISTGDRIRGAITGGAMGFYDFGMQGAVGGAIGGWFGRRKLGGSVGISGGWSERQGANIQGNIKMTWKVLETVADDTNAASAAILAIAEHAQEPEDKIVSAEGPQWSWASLIEVYNPSHAAEFEEIETFAAKRISTGDRIRGAITGGAMGFYDFGMQGAVGGAIGGWFGRQ